MGLLLQQFELRQQAGNRRAHLVGGIGDEALLRRYARARLWHTRAMAGAVDGLWQLFSTSAPGLRELRNHGMTLVDRISPLKRFLVSRALGA